MKRFTLIEKAFLLQTAPPFASLDLNLLLAVADKLVPCTYEPSQPIFVKNEEASRMYFIAQGTVEIQQGEEGATHRLNEGDYFGDEALFSYKSRSYSATSKTATLLFTLGRAHLHAVIAECPSVAMGFLRSYATRPLPPPTHISEEGTS